MQLWKNGITAMCILKKLALPRSSLCYIPNIEKQHYTCKMKNAYYCKDAVLFLGIKGASFQTEHSYYTDPKGRRGQKSLLSKILNTQHTLNVQIPCPAQCDGRSVFCPSFPLPAASGTICRERSCLPVRAQIHLCNESAQSLQCRHLLSLSDRHYLCPRAQD